MASPGPEVVVEHDKHTSVGFKLVNYWPDGTEEPPMLTHYRKVEVKASKSGKCSVCGKHASRKKDFYQTISPFNRNEDGQIKSDYEITKEEKAKAEKWKREPVCHVKCEEAARGA